MTAARRLAERTRWAHGPVVFLGGVLLDWSTLRMDRFADNALLVGYLVLLASVFATQLRLQRGRPVPARLAAWQGWFPLVDQFLLGALISALGVHVLRASDPGPTVLLIALFLALAVANETGFGALRGTLARMALLGFLSFQLLSLVIPVALGFLVGPAPPALGAALFCAAVLLLVHVPLQRRPDGAVADGVVGEIAAGAIAPVLAIATVLVLTRFGVVPALPLVLREAIVAHRVAWEDDELVIDAPHRDLTVRLGLKVPVMPWAPGRGVTVYTAIYAPAGMDLELVHRWARYDPATGDWATSDRIPLEVEGGRDAGWRTWSRKEKLQPGRWRVTVQTLFEQELGRVAFEVVEAPPEEPAIDAPAP